MNNDTILLENISKSFGEHQIIEDLNIEMTRGEIVSFIGANGTGKSTILKMIGLIYQDSEISMFLV
ncbi:MAG: ATP-binding cassette domain-containing protein [Coprobacillus cateniformis]